MTAATPTDHRDAADIATEAGRLLVALRASMHAAGADPADVRAEGDRSSHDFIVAALAAAHPDDAVLSEEGVDDPARLAAERVWIVDPLDGTREFGEDGRTDWAVHVALAIGGADRRRRGRAPRARAHAQRVACRDARTGARWSAASRREPHPPARDRPDPRRTARW